MGLQRDLKDTVRDTKNFIKGYSRVQVKLRRATSIDPWGPNSLQMEEIARATHSPTLLGDLIYVFDRRLNDHGKYWRHVYKSLLVMEYCIVCGSEAFVRYAKDIIYVIKTLKEFQYIDDRNLDRGALVRQKSREIVDLLQNEALLAGARQTKTIPQQAFRTSRTPSPLSRSSGASHRPAADEQEEQLRRAIEESKKTAAEEEEKRRRGRRTPSDELFFANVRASRNGDDKSLNDVNAATTTTIAHEQPKIYLTQVPHTITVNRLGGENEQKPQVFGFMERDPFDDVGTLTSDDDYHHSDGAAEADPFAAAEEVAETDPFRDAEEVGPVGAASPGIETNTRRLSAAELNIPIPKNPYERSSRSSADNIGAKPVKPMNLAPGFSTRTPSNNPHYNGSNSNGS